MSSWADLKACRRRCLPLPLLTLVWVILHEQAHVAAYRALGIDASIQCFNCMCPAVEADISRHSAGTKRDEVRNNLAAQNQRSSKSRRRSRPVPRSELASLRDCCLPCHAHLHISRTTAHNASKGVDPQTSALHGKRITGMLRLVQHSTHACMHACSSVQRATCTQIVARTHLQDGHELVV